MITDENSSVISIDLRCSFLFVLLRRLIHRGTQKKRTEEQCSIIKCDLFLDLSLTFLLQRHFSDDIYVCRLSVYIYIHI